MVHSWSAFLPLISYRSLLPIRIPKTGERTAWRLTLQQAILLLAFYAPLAFITPPANATALTLACLDLPPYTGASRQCQGLLSEITVTAGGRAGYQTEILLMPWKRVFAMAQRGAIDGIFCTTFSEERREFLAYSKEAISVEKYVLFAMKSSGLKGGPIESLRGSYFAEIPNSAWDTELRQRGISTILPISTEQQKFRALFAGRIHYALADELIGWAAANECCADSVDQLSVVGPTLRHASQFISISKRRHKDADAIAAKFDIALRSMLTDGTLRKIYARHGLEPAFESYKAYRTKNRD